MKKKQLKAQIRDLEDMLNIERVENESLNQELKLCEAVKNGLIKASNTMEEHYNSHMEIAKNEIERLNVIIGYLEDKLYEEELKDDNKTRVSK